MTSGTDIPWRPGSAQVIPSSLNVRLQLNEGEQL